MATVEEPDCLNTTLFSPGIVAFLELGREEEVQFVKLAKMVNFFLVILPALGGYVES